jgi:hypothetical protein
VVQADASAYIALADATTNWHHGDPQCLSGRDLTCYNFLSVSKEDVVPVSIKPASEARLGNVVFQWARKRMLSSYGITRNNISPL